MSWQDEIKKEDVFSTDGQKMQLIIEQLEFKLKQCKHNKENRVERINDSHVQNMMEKAIRFAKEIGERLQ